MSARFWLFSMASAGAAMAGGLGLGFYATTPPRAALDGYEDSAFLTERGQEATLDTAELNGPLEVRCRGCGPTLAQRQMYASYGAWDGYEDPAVRDYEATAPDEPQDLLGEVHDVPVSMAQPLPEPIERFASGEDSPPPPVRIAQGAPAASVEIPAGVATP